MHYISFERFARKHGIDFSLPFLHLDSICNHSKIYKCHFACFCAVTSKLFYNKLKWLWNNILLEETLDDCYMACSNIKTNSITSEPNVLEINVHDFERMTCYNERKWWQKLFVFNSLLKTELGRSQRYLNVKENDSNNFESRKMITFK